ncbi:gamma-glutamyl-gamma-aminobutyrate hydrolase family protein [Streptomyces sp. NBC_01343]|uniref:gamma-glutamyl-gamma-aminobutyrate hydrolase family protein n=1 Tax=Streptomyces sp. NBC_01343 TaxID=2903832 RepID=UPI002E14AEFE|nr:gamma-glutamyl-gamma-aminobutyrate hydrolase family protein [Streptomyces sp. NBC_01343]
MTTVPGTQVGALLPGAHQVATHHHQAVERLGAGLIVAASTADGTVEAIGSSRYRFAVGVQWPPGDGCRRAGRASPGGCRGLRRRYRSCPDGRTEYAHGAKRAGPDFPDTGVLTPRDAPLRITA